ncbi:hypothetical protein [Rubrivivax gelatinosus]|uniref:hypothetical protein n=1 Tax=Rubrivivax gelatinosus TaxID=28068 RepID=UPI0012FD3D25|nr:hypothetical protein [Rubrivivax gelatinosus]MBG6082990.1 hypothetical protein [Rubrivivax gelatinosus]
MKNLTALVAALTMAMGASAQTAGRNYNQEGKEFGKGQLDPSYNRAATTDPKTVPYYNENPPQKKSYGATSLFDVGTARINSCKGESPSSDRMANQECEAVNFLSKNPRAHFELSANDPAIIAARDAINNAGKYADSVNQTACTTKTTETPAETAQRVCAEYLAVDQTQCSVGWTIQRDDDSNFQCDQTYKATEILTCDSSATVTCANAGYEISGVSTKNSGIFHDVSVTPVPESDGLYKIRFATGARNGGPKRCGTQGWSEIGFNLDSAGSGGSTLTLQIDNLDDTLAIAVNDQTVFAYAPGYTLKSGYTNSINLDWLERRQAAFKLNYTWTQPLATCTNYTYTGGGTVTGCSQYEYSSTETVTYTAAAKLLDYCPSSLKMKPSAVPGRSLFCNYEGKLVLNGGEGSGVGLTKVDAELPLVKGANKITVYWGTLISDGGACGGVDVTGEIYNIKRDCEVSWSDTCSALEERSK